MQEIKVFYKHELVILDKSDIRDDILMDVFMKNTHEVVYITQKLNGGGVR